MGALDADDVVVLDSIRDPARFAEIFDRHCSAVFSYLARRVGRPGAEDLLGEVFRIAFERRGSYRREATNARPWLFGIATNLIHRHRRDEIRQVRALGRLGALSIAACDPTASTAGQLDDRADLMLVVRALERIASGERDALLLFAWEDLTYAEVADALDIPIGTVRSRINRARAQLTRALNACAPTRRSVGGDHDDR